MEENIIPIKNTRNT